MNKLILVRHGESVWNKENRFTGWTDVDLSEQGEAEARAAGASLREAGIGFDIAFTSLLKRAIRTLWMILEETDLMWIPVKRSWRLNERHYGALQGLNKAATAEKYGAEQVHIWRRSYDVQPPALMPDDPRAPGHDPRYRHLDPADLPLTECLKDAVTRMSPYWDGVIRPALQSGLDVLVAAHGNSLRALVKVLDQLGDQEIVDVEIPTGRPLIYVLDDTLRPVESYYLPEHPGRPDAAPVVPESGPGIKTGRVG